jgi:type VI secretion system protein ImpH
MADDGRAPSELIALFEAIRQAPDAFNFFPALRRIEAKTPARPRLGHSRRPAEDALRLGQTPSMIFAPSAISALEPAGETSPARLETYFFGLLGPNGPMPLHLTDYARNRLRNAADPTFARFLDLFHHRMASLFFRAWAAAEPTVSHDRPEQDQFATQLGSLMGLGFASLRGRDAMPDLAKLHFAGRFAAPARNPEGLRAILGSFFDVPVALHEFIPQWIELPTNALCRLGESRETGTLGTTATAGGRIRLYHHKFRIVLGPLSLTDYERLLPGGGSLARLVPAVRNYVGDELAWDLNLVLRRDEVPPTRLGMAGKLGWTSWIGTRRSPRDAGDLTLNPFFSLAKTRSTTHG